MLRIVVGQGVMNFIEYRTKEGKVSSQMFDMWYDSTVCPMGSRQYNSDVVRELPPVDVMYRLMVKMGYSGERIIDELLALYHRYRNFKVDYLADCELVLGFIGYRGTGKSASIAKVVCEDFLLAGKNAWSNMPISVEVVYKDAKKVFKTEPLSKLKLLQGDQKFRDGVAILDEVNMEVAEATRFMSNTNLEFRNQIQQIRKKGIDVIWSAQNWNSIDSGLRWQSDFITLCSLSKPEEKGFSSYWRVMDSTGLSGKLDFEAEMKSHYLMDKIVQEGSVFIRPWWHSYDTGKLQGQGSYNRKDLEKEEQKLEDHEAQDLEPVNEFIKIALQYKKKWNGGGDGRIYTKQVYEATGIGDNRSYQIQLGKAFHVIGYERLTDYKFGPYWTLKKEKKPRFKQLVTEDK